MQVWVLQIPNNAPLCLGGGGGGGGAVGGIQLIGALQVLPFSQILARKNACIISTVRVIAISIYFCYSFHFKTS